MTDLFVDGIDGFIEFPGGQVHILRKALFEPVYLFFKVGDVNLLTLYSSECCFIFQGIQGCIAKQGDDGDEKLGTNDIHLRVTIENIHDSGIVKLIV